MLRILTKYTQKQGIYLELLKGISIKSSKAEVGLYNVDGFFIMESFIPINI